MQYLSEKGLVVDAERVITSALLTAIFIKEKHPDFKKVLCFGTDALAEAFKTHGIEPILKHADCSSYDEVIFKLKVDPDIKAVVIGHD